MDRAQGMSVLKTGQEGEEEKQASGVLGAKGGRAQEESRQQCPHVHVPTAESCATCMLAGFYLIIYLQ